MRLTLFTDYGLRALMRLAGEPHRTFTTEEIAGEFGISRNHLVKIVRALAEAGIVRTQRGAAGGFVLAKGPDTITVGDVVRHLEAREAIVECFRPDGGTCVLSPSCRLKGYIRLAEDAFVRELDKVTLADCIWVPQRSASKYAVSLDPPGTKA